MFVFFFFFNDTATTEIYTLSLHDALPICERAPRRAETTDPVDRDISDFPHAVADSDFARVGEIFSAEANPDRKKPFDIRRSEEHTSELQSQSNLVCRLLLEKKKT